MQENIAAGRIEIIIPEADEWVERIGKTAYEMCNNNRNRNRDHRITVRALSNLGVGWLPCDLLISQLHD